MNGESNPKNEVRPCSVCEKKTAETFCYLCGEPMCLGCSTEDDNGDIVCTACS